MLRTFLETLDAFAMSYTPAKAKKSVFFHEKVAFFMKFYTSNWSNSDDKIQKLVAACVCDSKN